MFIWEIIIMTTFFLSLMMGRLFYSNICLIECLKEIYFFLFLFRTIELLRLIWLPQFSLLLSGLAFIVSCWWFSLFSIWRLDLFPCLKFYFQECWDGYMIFLYFLPWYLPNFIPFRSFGTADFFVWRSHFYGKCHQKLDW